MTSSITVRYSAEAADREVSALSRPHVGQNTTSSITIEAEKQKETRHGRAIWF